MSETNRLKIASAMIKAGKDPGDIPAGFTYLGQFVDHDLTSDRTKVELGEHVSPGELIQGRSPSLDLDSLYGAGPLDEDSERFYSDGVHLKVGRTLEAEPGAGFDLPRVGTGNDRQARKANIPDLRNDENLAVAQTHAAFIRFHNRVVDEAGEHAAGESAVPSGAPQGCQALPVDAAHRFPATDHRSLDRR